jgi:hypothetical protein
MDSNNSALGSDTPELESVNSETVQPPVTVPYAANLPPHPPDSKFLGGGYFSWYRMPRYHQKIKWAAIATVGFVLLSYFEPIWPFFLAAEIAAVILGLVFGWCRVDFDRMKVRGPLNPKGELDQLGFFNSRVAMRSLELFKITIADMPIPEAERNAANELVERYWYSKEKP